MPAIHDSTSQTGGAAQKNVAPLLQAYSGARPDRIPVWFMRQAGRSLPEYRKVRAGVGMLEACLRPELAAEITCQPVRRHGVDAAILFSDIVTPLKVAGVGVDIVAGTGPVFDAPLRSADDVAKLTAHDAGDLSAVQEAVRLACEELSAREQPVPLIGFGGAPFTLAAYLVEGRPSRDHLAARAMMHADPQSWDRLMTWVADLTATFLQAQIDAGASAVQLFDSWAGSLSRRDYVERVAPYSARTLAAVDGQVPRVHFAASGAHLLADLRDAGAEVVGVDYRLDLDEAAGILGSDVVVQGNINPALLTAPWPVLEAHVRDVVERGRSARAHVVNLGHGVPPSTDPTVLTRIVDLVHAL